MNEPDPVFRTVNYIEAGLWIVLALVIVSRLPRTRRAQAVFAAVCLLLFGVSDIVEAGTGAWWRPWWLLLWKGACLSGILWWGVSGYLRERRNR